MLGYGTEMTVSFNRNSLLKNEEGLTTDVANSNIKNKQTLLASFLDLRTSYPFSLSSTEHAGNKTIYATRLIHKFFISILFIIIVFRIIE